MTIYWRDVCCARISPWANLLRYVRLQGGGAPPSGSAKIMLWPAAHIDGWPEQRPISPRGRRTLHLAAQTKNVLPHQTVEERSISPRGRRTSYLGAFTASTWPIYGEIDVLRPRGEIERSSTSRWDRTLMNFKYIILINQHPNTKLKI